MEGVQEVVLYYDAIVISGVKGVQKLTEVSDPSCYLFAFDIG